MTKVIQNTQSLPFCEKKNSGYPIVKTPFLDTLAQPGPSKKKKTANPLKRRAVSKFLSNEIIHPLISLDSSLKKSYWNTFHCSNILLQEGKKVTGKYCNNRWCLVCNRIRTAKMINQYLPVIKEEIKEPYFVTLTVPNVNAKKLKTTIDGMIKTTTKINSFFRHHKEFRIKGIRKLECTHNKERNDYHPHFHFILDTEKAGRELIKEWLKHYPNADIKAQDIKPANENSLIEIFKYTTKIVTGKDIIRTANTIELKIDPFALDVIFEAMRGKRSFQSIGITKVAINEDIEEIQAQTIDELVPDSDVWAWVQGASDWVSTYGECLTGSNANEIYKVSKQKNPLII